MNLSGVTYVHVGPSHSLIAVRNYVYVCGMNGFEGLAQTYKIGDKAKNYLFVPHLLVNQTLGNVKAVGIDGQMF